MKKCLECKNDKELKYFYKDKSRKDGYTFKCKECIKSQSNTYYLENKESHKNRCIEWQEKHSEEQKHNNKKSYDKLKQNKEWVTNKYTYNKAYQQLKYNKSPEYKLLRILRNRFRTLLKNQIKTHTAINLLGCNIEDFTQHITNQLYPEMSWENHGVIWEIDHIKPCSSFDLTCKIQQKECFHHTNLQPLFKTTEIAKSFGYTDQIGNRNKSNKI